jgi:hypothetical protein
MRNNSHINKFYNSIFNTGGRRLPCGARSIAAMEILVAASTMICAAMEPAKEGKSASTEHAPVHPAPRIAAMAIACPWAQLTIAPIVVMLAPAESNASKVNAFVQLEKMNVETHAWMRAHVRFPPVQTNRRFAARSATIPIQSNAVMLIPTLFACSTRNAAESPA